MLSIVLYSLLTLASLAFGALIGFTTILFFRYRWYIRLKVWYIGCASEYLYYRLSIGENFSEEEMMATFNAWGTGDFEEDNYDTWILADIVNWKWRKYIKDIYRFKKVEDYVTSLGADINKPINKVVMATIERIKEEIITQIETIKVGSSITQWLKEKMGNDREAL